MNAGVVCILAGKMAALHGKKERMKRGENSRKVAKMRYICRRKVIVTGVDVSGPLHVPGAVHILGINSISPPSSLTLLSSWNTHIESDEVAET